MRKYFLNMNFKKGKKKKQGGVKERESMKGEELYFCQVAVVFLCDAHPGRRVFTAHRVHFTSD